VAWEGQTGTLWAANHVLIARNPSNGEGGIQKYGTWSLLCRGAPKNELSTIFVQFRAIFAKVSQKNRGICTFSEVSEGENWSGPVRSRKSTVFGRFF
jgi:hypothetical protein